MKSTIHTISVILLLLLTIPVNAQVAEISSNKYSTLQDAVDAYNEKDFNNGVSIELLQNVELGTSLTIDKSVIIAGNGHTISCNFNSSTTISITDGEAIDITLKGIIIKTTYRGIAFSGSSNNCSLKLDDCTLFNTMTDETKYTEECSNISSARGLSLWNTCNSNITINNCKIYGFKTSVYAGSDKNSQIGCTVTAEKSEFYGLEICRVYGIAGSNFSFNNCNATCTLPGDKANDKFSVFNFTETAQGNILNVNKGTYLTTYYDASSRYTHKNYMLTCDGTNNQATFTGTYFSCISENNGGLLSSLASGSSLTINSGDFQTYLGMNVSDILGSMAIKNGSFLFYPSRTILYGYSSASYSQDLKSWIVGPIYGTTYAGNSTKLTSIEWENFSSFRKDYPNAIMLVSSDYVTDDTNIIPNVVVDYIVGNGHYYECADLELTDRQDGVSTDFYTPVDFITIGGNYTRTLYDNTTSWCVPFQLNEADFTSYCDKVKMLTFAFFENGNTAYFSTRESIGAGIPFMLYLNKQDTDGWSKEGWTKTFNHTAIAAKPENSTDMQGTFVQTDSYEEVGYYGVGIDRKTLADFSDSPLGAFRSLISLQYNSMFNSSEDVDSRSDARPQVLNIGIVGTTRISVTPSSNPKVSENHAYYDISGRRLTSPQKGINLINGKILVK